MPCGPACRTDRSVSSARRTERDCTAKARLQVIVLTVRTIFSKTPHSALPRACTRAPSCKCAPPRQHSTLSGSAFRPARCLPAQADSASHAVLCLTPPCLPPQEARWRRRCRSSCRSCAQPPSRTPSPRTAESVCGAWVHVSPANLIPSRETWRRNAAAPKRRTVGSLGRAPA